MTGQTGSGANGSADGGSWGARLSTDRQLFARVAKAALSLGNLHDGGHVIIGIDDTRQQEMLPGLDASDLARIREFVEAGATRTAFAVFIDEGRHFCHRPEHPGTAWRAWDPSRPGSPSPSVLWARWPPG